MLISCNFQGRHIDAKNDCARGEVTIGFFFQITPNNSIQLNQVSMILFLNMKHCLFLVLWFESNNEKALQMMKQITENMKKTKEETAKEKVYLLALFTY